MCAGNGSLGPLEEQPLLSTSVFSPACLLFVGILLFRAAAVIVVVGFFYSFGSLLLVGHLQLPNKHTESYSSLLITNL